MSDIEQEDYSALVYALSIKGGYYTHGGAIAQDISEAKLFATREDAIAFRAKFDQWNQVTQSIILAIALLIEEEENDQEV